MDLNYFKAFADELSSITGINLFVSDVTETRAEICVRRGKNYRTFTLMYAEGAPEGFKKTALITAVGGFDLGAFAFPSTGTEYAKQFDRPAILKVIKAAMK